MVASITTATNTVVPWHALWPKTSGSRVEYQALEPDYMSKVCPGKAQPLSIYQEQFERHQCNLAAKESGLECPWVNNNHFTALVSGAVDTMEHA